MFLQNKIPDPFQNKFSDPTLAPLLSNTDSIPLLWHDPELTYMIGFFGLGCKLHVLMPSVAALSSGSSSGDWTIGAMTSSMS